MAVNTPYCTSLNKRLLLSSRVSVGRAWGRLVNHVHSRPKLPAHASQDTRARHHAACDQDHAFSRNPSRFHLVVLSMRPWSACSRDKR